MLGDARRIGLKDRSVQCVITSPPYFAQRRYGVEGEIGLESTPDEYVEQIVVAFCEVRRVLRDDGVAWIVLGDSYSHAGSAHRDPKRWPKQAAGAHHVGRIKENTGAKPKSLLMIPARVALALQAEGWYLRSDVIWSKANPMPSSAKDRPASAHEYVFLVSKSETYYYNAEAIAEPAVTGGLRNRRDVWTFSTARSTRGNHYAVMPSKLAELCILAGSRPGDLVFDPFIGSGTTAIVAERHGRRWVGMDLNPKYLADVNRAALARARAHQEILEIMGCDAA